MDELYNLWNFSDLAIGEKDLPKSIFNDYGKQLSKDTDNILYYKLSSIIDYNILIDRFTIKKKGNDNIYIPFYIKVDIMSGSSYPCTFIDYDDNISTCETPSDLRNKIEMIVQSSKNIERLTKFFYI